MYAIKPLLSLAVTSGMLLSYRSAFASHVDDVLQQSTVLIASGKCRGTGVVVRTSGMDADILTAGHVIVNSTRATVTIQDGRRFEGVVVRRASFHDLVLLRITGYSLPPAITLSPEPPHNGELAQIHADYHFVPQLDREDDNNRLNEFLATPLPGIGKSVATIALASPSAKAVNPML